MIPEREIMDNKLQMNSAPSNNGQQESAEEAKISRSSPMRNNSDTTTTIILHNDNKLSSAEFSATDIDRGREIGPRSTINSAASQRVGISQHSNIKANHTHPIIHTDRVNASSPILFVRDRHQLAQILASARDSKQLIMQATNKPNIAASGQQDQQTSDTKTITTISPANSTSSASNDHHLQQQQHYHGNLIKIEILELEIGSSSIRLAWTIPRRENHNPPRRLFKRDNSKPQKSVQMEAMTTTIPPKSVISVPQQNATARRAPTNSHTTTKSSTTIKNWPSRTGKMINLINKNDTRESHSLPTWLVRLRQFGSLESDVVKLVIKSQQNPDVKNTTATTTENLVVSSPIRYITFTNLVPSTAYELCVEVSNLTGISHLEDPNDLLNMQIARSQQHSQLADCKNETTAGHDDSSSSTRKCREFFTTQIAATETIKLGRLPLHEVHRVSGAIEDLATEREQQGRDANSTQAPASVSDASYHLRRAKSLASARQNNHLHSVANVNLSSNPTGMLSNQLIKNRIELLEIDDSTTKDSQIQVADSWFPSFQMPAAKNSKEGPLNNLISSNSHLPSTTATSRVDPQAASENLRFLQAANNNNNNASDASKSGRLLALGWSMPPLIGYMFIVIFVLALINLIINSLTATSSSCLSSPGRSPHSSPKRRKRHLATGQLTLSIPASPTNQEQQVPATRSSSSFYNYRNGVSPRISNSRLMLVGGGGGGSSASKSAGLHQANWQPYSQSVAALHELPLAENQHQWSSTMLLSKAANARNNNKQAASSSVGAKSKATSQVLSLVSTARFPLGPSFEGDSKHNADMVGLARKNYDLLMSKMFNASIEDQDQDYDAIGAHLSGADRHSMHSFKSISNSNCSAGNASTQPGCATRHRPDHHEHKKRAHHHHHKALKYQQKQLADYQENNNSINQLESSGIINSTLNGRNMRFRYDKINPLYNMTMPKSSASFDVDQQTNRNSSSSSTSTSSHPNNKIQEPRQLLKSFSNPNQQQQQQSASSHEALVSISSQDSASLDCQDENCPENLDLSELFDCCLDRQQQRFQQQQLQLERRPRIDGSNKPQPFIMPVPASDDEDIEVTQDLAINSPDFVRDSLLTGAIPPPPPPPPQFHGANRQSNLFKAQINSNQSQIETPEPPEPLSLGAYDEMQSLNQRQPNQTNQISVAPKSRSTNHYETKIPSAAQTKGVEVCEISAAQSPLPEIIDRGDFEQRRQELKSKLLFRNRQKM